METVLQRLMEIEGVTGTLLVGKDGLVVASTMEGEDEEFLAAMSAACYDASIRYIDQLGMGDVRHAMFETVGGTIQITDAGELLLVDRNVCFGQSGLRLAQILAGLAGKTIVTSV